MRDLKIVVEDDDLSQPVAPNYVPNMAVKNQNTRMTVERYSPAKHEIGPLLRQKSAITPRKRNYRHNGNDLNARLMQDVENETYRELLEMEREKGAKKAGSGDHGCSVKILFGLFAFMLLCFVAFSILSMQSLAEIRKNQGTLWTNQEQMRKDFGYGQEAGEQAEDQAKDLQQQVFRAIKAM